MHCSIAAIIPSLFFSFSTVLSQSLSPDWPTDVIPAFRPEADLTIFYPLVTVTANTSGVQLTPSEASAEPQYVISPAVSGPFLLFMVDPDAPNPQNPTASQILHMFRTDIEVQTNGLLLLPNETIASYIGPGPPAGSDPHRYTFVLFHQPLDFELPFDLLPTMRAFFNLTLFAERANLGAPIAGNFFIAESEQNQRQTSSSTLLEEFPTATLSSSFDTTIATITPYPTISKDTQIFTPEVISTPSQQELANVTRQARFTIGTDSLHVSTISGALPTVGFRNPNLFLTSITSASLVLPTGAGGLPMLNETGLNNTVSNGSQADLPPVELVFGAASRAAGGTAVWAICLCVFVFIAVLL